MTLSEKHKHEMLKLARKSIAAYLERRSKVYPKTSDPVLQSAHGVFVTLRMAGELRGCIGYPLPYKPLVEGIVDNAIAAACEDPRFSPISLPDLQHIEIEISVLTEPQAIESVKEIEIGRDGIIISKGFNRGLLLPQVPVEEGWNLDEYLTYGCMKAGLPAEAWKKGVRIETFQAIVFSENEGKHG